MSSGPISWKRKWLYEEIVERVPPFRWLPPTLDVVAQLLLVETVGILAFLYFQMPLNAVIFGSLAIVYTVVWSAGCLYVIPWLRRLRDPTNEQENQVLARYKNRLLNDRRAEVLGATVCFVGVGLYLFIDQQILQHFLGTGFGNPFLFILILILSWDIAYRLWLSLMTTLNAAWRSIGLARAARSRRGLEYTAYSEVNTLRSLDLINLYWAGTAVLLVPIASTSYFLSLGIVGFLAAILGFSLISLMAMELVPWFPPDVESVLFHERFAYVSVYTKNEPHTTPVIFGYDGKYLYFAISFKSAKYRLIKENNRIAVLVDMRDKGNIMNNRTILMRGKGLLLGELTPFGILRMFIHGLWMIKVRMLFAKKYPKYMKYYKEKADTLPPAWQSTPLLSRVLVRLEPEQVTYWREAIPISLRV
ncbi:MAG: pyridoxamine 5'-phosphate oxidase family protein [Candidatus Thorarchaeota archaeon]|nr:pyridoxamine 5'-phosphate oxidase family protein [Candidatus Thorarchaeota archaeon]